MPIPVRSRERIEDAHDAITELLQAPEVIRVLLPNPSDRDYMRGAVNALCWALVHEGGGARAFMQNLKILKQRLLELREAMADDPKAPAVAGVDPAEETAQGDEADVAAEEEVRANLHAMIQTFADKWGPPDKPTWNSFVTDMRIVCEAFGMAAIMHSSLPDVEHAHGDPVA